MDQKEYKAIVKKKLKKKGKKAQARFPYLVHKRATPTVKDTDDPLVRNNKVLQEMLAEHEALLAYREEHREENKAMFDLIKEEQKQIAKQMEETNEG